MTEKTMRMTKEPVWLEITGAYGTHADAPAEGTNVFEAIKDLPQGHEDKDGVEHFNSRVMTPFGLLGEIKTHLEAGEDGQPVKVIDRADAVVLVSRAPLEQWGASQQVGSTIELNPFGFRVFQINARNGMVRYALYDDEVRWRDRPDEVANIRVAKLMQSQWTPEAAPPPRLTHRADVRVVRNPS